MTEQSEKLRELSAKLSTASVFQSNVTITSSDARLWSRSMDSIANILDRDAYVQISLAKLTLRTRQSEMINDLYLRVNAYLMAVAVVATVLEATS